MTTNPPPIEDAVPVGVAFVAPPGTPLPDSWDHLDGTGWVRLGATVADSMANPATPLPDPLRRTYQSLVESTGCTVVVAESDGDYEGSSLLLLHRGDEYGVLLFGWGSCSGCDALEGCETDADFLELRDQLTNDVRWFGSLTDAALYVRDRDWPLFQPGDPLAGKFKAAVAVYAAEHDNQEGTS